MMFRQAAPRAVALRTLHALYGSAAPECAGHQPSALHLAAFQEDAVAIASGIIARRGGVIVADSVGLGKTYVALGLIENAMRAAQNVIVITPASLRRDWTRHLAALEESSAHPSTAGARVRWLSHTRLSRMGTSAAALRASLERRPLVVVDEAHAFRSVQTRRYRALASLCRNSDVLLVTATPVNNSLLDLYNLIRLFASDTALQDAGVPHLGSLFREHAAAARDSVFLRAVVSALVVRRTRAFVKQHYNQQAATPGLRFPAAAPPVPMPYALAARAPDARTLLAIVRSLTLAPYRVLAPAGRPPRGFSAELVRFHLLKRLESSVAAFHATAARLLAFYHDFASNLRAGRMALLRGAQSAGGDPLQLSLDAMLTVPVPKSVDVDTVLRECTADSKNLAKAVTLAAAIVANDPKLAQLKDLLYGRLHGRKVVIFAEYRDTAEYLWRNLVLAGRVGHIDGENAHLGQSRATRRMVIERFAPHSNRVRAPLTHERVDLLVTTDVLSEGINLQDASAVISYDLPWNPVRLIQRVGRIDRLGSPHEWIGSYHFVPDEMLDEMLGLMEKLRRKVRAIRASVGAESSVLGPDPTRVLQDLRRGDATAFDRAETSSLDNTPEERVRALYLRFARTSAASAPDRSADQDCLACEIQQPECVRDHWLVTYLQGARARCVIVEDGTVRAGGEQAARVLGHILTDEHTSCAAPLNAGLEDIAGMVREHAGREPRGSPGEAAARLIARVNRLAANVPGGPTDDQCRRIDRARSVINGWSEASAEALFGEISRHGQALSPLAHLEAALRQIEQGSAPTSNGSPAPEPFRILAIIAVLAVQKPARESVDELPEYR